MPRTPIQQSLLEVWLRKHSQPIDPRRRKTPDGRNIGESQEPILLTPTQEVLLRSWLKQHREPADSLNRQVPANGIIGEAREPMPLASTQEVVLEDWLKKPIDLKRKSPGAHQTDKDAKWTDDAGFEKRYGDPEYYKRVNGLEYPRPTLKQLVARCSTERA